MSSAGEYLAEMTGDLGWSYLRPHDLRRTWATALAVGAEVDPLLVCEWGRWDDLDTFVEHYIGVYSPQVQRRELGKVEWFHAESAVNVDRDPRIRLLHHADGVADSGDPSSPVTPRGATMRAKQFPIRTQTERFRNQPTYELLNHRDSAWLKPSIGDNF